MNPHSIKTLVVGMLGYAHVTNIRAKVQQYKKMEDGKYGSMPHATTSRALENVRGPVSGSIGRSTSGYLYCERAFYTFAKESVKPHSERAPCDVVIRMFLSVRQENRRCK